ncbi:MAG: type VI secretion system tube protein Hcp [Nitrospirota bacterium]|nr:type VI secretion system tube protein Hcp [Nitrospirota bacterium]
MRTSLFASIIMISLFLVGNVMESHAGEAYLKIPDIPGESVAKGREGQLRVLNYSWGGEKTSGMTSMKGRTRAQSSQLKNLTIHMTIDQSFPKLAFALAAGRNLGEVTLEEVHPQTRKPIFEIKLRAARISSIELGSEEQGPALVTVSFLYDRIEWIFTKLDRRTGEDKGKVQGYWDLKTNTGNQS